MSLTETALTLVLGVLLVATIMLGVKVQDLNITLDVERGARRLAEQREQQARAAWSRQVNATRGHLDRILVAMGHLHPKNPTSQEVLDAALVDAILFRETEQDGGMIGHHPARDAQPQPTPPRRRTLP